MLKKDYRVGILGLGYVGTPLLNDILDKKIKVVGYDISLTRINSLRKKKVNFSNHISNDPKILKNCNIYLVCVPTPINNKKKSNLKFLKNACMTISKYIKRNDIIIFESTVYPGVTQNICLPLLKNNNENIFYIGYAPERISPGDKKKNYDISKIVAAENKKIGIKIKKFYENFIKKVYLAPKIEVAELAKNFENCQRDLNIALMNDLYMLCEKVDINPYDVINACKTKWNFTNYFPGLVGGHCISVDPYYLIEYAKKNKFRFRTLKISRQVNENFIFDIKNKIKKFFIKNKLSKKDNILFIGGTYKKNIDDIRNSGALKIYKNISKYYKKSVLYDPYLIKNNFIPDRKYKAVIIIVFHDLIYKNKKAMKIINSTKFVLDLFQNLKK